jgi:hypothetical protein
VILDSRKTATILILVPKEPSTVLGVLYYSTSRSTGELIRRRISWSTSLQFVYQGLMKEWIYDEEYLYGNQDIFHTLINSCGCVTPENGYLNLEKVQATQHK